MAQKEIVALNFFPSNMGISPRSTEHERNMLLRSLYRSLVKHIASKGFAIFPHRPGIRFFADSDEVIDVAGTEHHLVHVESWGGKINEIRFHDGFVSQVEFIDGKIWLKIDPRQTVLVKGNEQTNRDFIRSFYVSYCPFSTCENRSECLLARPKALQAVHFSEDKEKVIWLKDMLGVGCRFYKKLKSIGNVIEAEWRRKPILIPWRAVYFKGAITDMPSWQLRKFYQERCLLKSKERLALTQFGFSVLSDNKDSFSIQYEKDRNEISFGNMFKGEVEL